MCARGCTSGFGSCVARQKHQRHHRPYISLIEIGRKQPTLSVLLRLAEGLEYTLAEFMERGPERYLPEQTATGAE
jgi:transcriptional regulator with XRE-family HTH domain